MIQFSTLSTRLADGFALVLTIIFLQAFHALISTLRMIPRLVGPLGFGSVLLI